VITCLPGQPKTRIFRCYKLTTQNLLICTQPLISNPLQIIKSTKGLIVRMLHMVPVFLLMFFVSCIDPINIDIDSDLGILIVEGAITTGRGPHKIRLSQSARYGNNVFEGSVLPVTNASVIIRDSDGNNFLLTEEDFRFVAFRPPAWPNADGQETYLTGVYATTNDFSAVAGETYTLLITTREGIEYISLPEKVIPATDIQGLSAEFSKVPIGSNEYKTGVDVYATFQDPLEEQNFYMWKNSGTYKITAFPALHVIIPTFPPGPAIPDPKDCCRNCWVNESSAARSLLILSDKNINGNKTTIFTAFIQDDSIRFTDKYLVRIELHTLNREAFQYFSLLKNQLSINGDIFDPPPATLRGNMINMTNPDENVLGYFRVSSVSIDSMFLTRDMLLEPKPLLRFNNDCLEYRYGFATTEEPSYW